MLATLADLSVVAGDTFYGSASGTVSRLAKGTDGQVYKLASGIPSWASLAVSDLSDAGLQAISSWTQAQGIRADLLERLLAGTEADILGLRDRALLQVAYDTLSRRSELVALRIEDIRRHEKPGEPKMTIFLRRSKTDLEGQIGRAHV